MRTLRNSEAALIQARRLRKHVTARVAFRLWIPVVACIVLVACAATPGKISITQPIPELNTPKQLALRGYDAVAYFTENKPVQGSAAYQYSWHGAQWRFASQAHRDVFAKNPDGYAPQFGGYCAYAVSRGTVANGDPLQWAVVNDKLYLNVNAIVKNWWDQDRLGNITAGDQNWPLIPKQPKNY